MARPEGEDRERARFDGPYPARTLPPQRPRHETVDLPRGGTQPPHVVSPASSPRFARFDSALLHGAQIAATPREQRSSHGCAPSGIRWGSAAGGRTRHLPDRPARRGRLTPERFPDALRSTETARASASLSGSRNQGPLARQASGPAPSRVTPGRGTEPDEPRDFRTHPARSRGSRPPESECVSEADPEDRAAPRRCP